MRTEWQGFLSQVKAYRLTSMLLVLVTLGVGILLGTVISQEVRGKENPAANATPVQVPAPQQLSSVFSKVAQEIEPSVVNINTESTVRSQARPRTPGGDEGGVEDFFDRFFGGPNARPEGLRQRSLGSGVILDSKGFIITNAHVVERADRIRVSLMGDAPGTFYEAKVIGTDRETDLAVIKIEVKKPLPAARLGNSDSASVGDWVLAIGSPFGLQQTVTAGIISSKGRNIDNRRQFQSFLQTDAAINPGNSGGPLVNMNGEVIGINTAIFTQSAGSQGVGFAMPANTVADVYNQLIGPGNRVTRGSIGVTFNAQANDVVSRVYGVASGVTLTGVTAGGPAEKAGLKIGDTIVSVEGRKIENGDDLVAEIAARKPGNSVKLKYIRSGKEETATVTIADRAKLFGTGDDEEEVASEDSAPESRLGVTVRSLTPQQAERAGLPAGKGVLVTDVKARSFAEDIGFARGQVVLEVNRQPVASEEDFRRITAGLKSGDDVVFLIQQGVGRNAGTVFLAGTLP